MLLISLCTFPKKATQLSCQADNVQFEFVAWRGHRSSMSHCSVPNLTVKVDLSHCELLFLLERSEEVKLKYVHTWFPYSS